MALKVLADRKYKKIYREGDTRVKLFDEHYTKTDVLTEAYNQSVVEETGLNIPKILEVKKIDGKWASVAEYVEGETIESLMKKNSEKIDEYLKRFVLIQIDMHSRTSANLIRLTDKMTMKIMDANIDATSKYDLLSRMEAISKHNVICHGDYNPSNVLIKADGSACIIDWTHVSRGNAAADAARTYLYLAVREEYKDLADKYLDLFCENCTVERARVLRWLPLVAASLIRTSRSEEETKYLLSWINSVVKE